MKTVKGTIAIPLQNQPPDHNVYLSINAGDGQVDYSAFVDFDEQYVHGIVQNYNLGRVSAVRGKKLKSLITLVLDTNPFSNFTSVIYSVNGWQSAPQSAEADKDRGIVLYNMTLQFT